MPAAIPIGAEPGSTGQKIATLALHEPAAASPADLVTYSLLLPVGSQSKQQQQITWLQGRRSDSLAQGLCPSRQLRCRPHLHRPGGPRVRLGSTVRHVSLEVTIAGDGCRFTLRVDGYQFPQMPADYNDANWLVGQIDLSAGARGAFSARLCVTPYALDLQAFRNQLQTLDRELTGQATLAHVEDQFEVVVTLANGKGKLSGYVREHVGARLRVAEFETGQTFVRQALNEFEALVTAFPVRYPLGG